MRGVELGRAYFHDVVGPELDRRWPGLRYAAGRLGAGSDVLGLDDEMSRDHDWGLRLTVLVDDAAPGPHAVSELLHESLPDEYRGYPTRFATTWDGQLRHRVDVSTTDELVARHIGTTDPGGLDALGWLAVTGQSALELTAGPLFRDTTGRFTRVREALVSYPPDLRLHVLSAGWWRISQEIHLLGRAGQLGDAVGARTLLGRITGAVLHLACVVENVWAPYPKWLGTVVSALPTGASVLPALDAALASEAWTVRQERLADALTALHDAQRAAGLPAAPGGPVQPFFDRPFVGVVEDVVEALRAAVGDPVLRALPPGLGAIEQWCDSPAILVDPTRRGAVVRAAALAA